MKKPQTIDSFFKKNDEIRISQSNPSIDINHLNSDGRPAKSLRIECNDRFDVQSIERDPGLRPRIWEYPIEKRDKFRRACIKAGPYQCMLSNYPKSREKHPRSFQASWFKLFPSWLEYSRIADATFCLPCHVFHAQDRPSGLDAFTINGFCSWKKVRDGKNCVFLAHIGKDLTSPHRKAEKACEDLMNQQSYILQSFEKFTSQEVAANRICLKSSIEATRWLAFQRYFYQTDLAGQPLLSFIASYNDKVVEVLDKAPRNASFTSPTTQKQILQVLAAKVKNIIREKIGDAKFCIIVDEARDESKKEQMSIVLKFVDKDGYVQERFFGLVHVKDIVASTLKEGIFSVLSSHTLDVQNIRGQGYDGASNMHGEWNGLKALILSECPYVYHVHCFAHRFQLALVAASKGVITVHHFFTKLSSIINVVGASCKRNDQLKASHASNIAHLLNINELESGKRRNQIGSLQRTGDIRWSSHLKSISSLIKMFNATCEVLLSIIEDGNTPAQCGDDAAYEILTSFEFVFILHLMRKILEIF
ncbi:uncharacterized protein [Henckelia pumila]|uniref:uncharacterized protein n=1 Tax=Henckelia pumila TaxID=405737 RepID=UPI003C6E157D